MLAPDEREDPLGQLTGLAPEMRRWASDLEHRISAVAELIVQSSAQGSSGDRQAAERPARRTRAGPRSVA